MTRRGAAGVGAAGRAALDETVGSKGSVLVTRPAGQADALCAAVEAAGYTAHSQPLLELQALSELPPSQRQLLLDLDRYQHVIFISGNAVHFGMACIEDYWPQVPVGLTWYAIGDATAALLHGFGIEAVTPGSAMTSEGLLAVPQLHTVADQRILIIKGEGGRATLREELACYRRACPDLPAGELAARLSEWRIGLVMISSGEGLDNLQTLLRWPETTKFRHICVIVPSERIARLAQKAGFEQVVTAENASDVAMLHALEEWKPGSGE
jgi:uroporphyrinogen-III synthase